MPETNQFLSDTRYLIGAVAVPRGMPLFRWNEDDSVTRESALKEWIKQGCPSLEPLLAGCAFQPLLADAYHAACRLADMASRPYSLRASVAFLQTTRITSYNVCYTKLLRVLLTVLSDYPCSNVNGLTEFASA